MSLQLYNAIIDNKSVSGKIDKWIKNFHSDKNSAITNMINFVLRCSGGEQDWIASDVEMEGLLPEELDELLREMIDWMELKLIPDKHILSGKTKKNRKHRERYVKLWSEFVRRVILATADDQSSSDNAIVIIPKRP